jgi:hypothetical protein
MVRSSIHSAPLYRLPPIPVRSPNLSRLVMSSPRCLFPAVCLLSLLFAPALPAADTAATPAGYWSGTISLPNQELGLSIELALAGASNWQGTIDIPQQGLRGYKLDPMKVVGPSVEFGLPGIPGDPYFNAKMAADGQILAGRFSQSGNTFPFRFERMPKPAPAASEAVPAEGVPGEGLPGNWRGAIAPQPNVQLRLEVEIKGDQAGKTIAVLISLDQGRARLPISNLTQIDRAVAFDVPSVNGNFRGTMRADGAEIAGAWSQNGRSTPLVLKRLSVPQP